MSKWLLRGFFSTLKWALCAVGAVALLLTALIATPLTRPPELHSLSASRGTIDFSALPPIARFQARDGTMLGFRHYAASGPATGRGAIVIHGSSGSSGTSIHALSDWEVDGAEPDRRHRRVALYRGSCQRPRALQVRPTESVAAVHDR